MKRKLSAFVMLLTFVASTSFAAIPKLKFSHEFDINDYKGKTFLYFMNSEGGVKDAADEIAKDGFELDITAKKIDETLKNVDPKVARKYIGANFKDSLSFSANLKANKARVDSVKELGAALSDGTVYTYDSAASTVRANLGEFNLAGTSQYSMAMFLQMASGAGVSVNLDSDNYFFNIGYDSFDEKKVQTGRSFSASPVYAANDASDLHYLDHLEEYFRDDKEQEKFYTTLMQTLTKSDVSGLKKLTQLGQAVTTDFIAVYTAESLRHLMVNLSPATAVWEWDLAAATMVSVFNVESGYMMKAADPTNPNVDISLVKARLRDHWTMNPETKRSGIGKTKKARKMLSKAITAYELKKNPALVKAIADIVGSSANRDAIQATVEFLSNTKTPDSLGAKADKLTTAVVKFLMQVKKDSKAIAKEILANQDSLDDSGDESDEE